MKKFFARWVVLSVLLLLTSVGLSIIDQQYAEAHHRYFHWDEGLKITDLEEFWEDREHFESTGNELAFSLLMDSHYICTTSAVVPGCYKRELKWFYLMAFILAAYPTLSLLRWAFREVFLEARD